MRRWIKKQKPSPTDYELLEAVYNRYYDEFAAHPISGPGTRESKIYVPVDCIAIGEQLGVDPDVVFGRLYYHLDKRYGYNDPQTPLFTRAAGKDKDCVHFPLLASVLAQMREDRRKENWTRWLSIAAIIVSVATAAFSLAC